MDKEIQEANQNLLVKLAVKWCVLACMRVWVLSHLLTFLLTLGLLAHKTVSLSFHRCRVAARFWLISSISTSFVIVLIQMVHGLPGSRLPFGLQRKVFFPTVSYCASISHYIQEEASGCVVECRICNWEVAGSNLGLGYFALRSTQPSIHPGSVNEYQL